MATFEDFLGQATTPGPNRLLTGGVVIAATKDGIAYSKGFGTQSVDPDSPLVDTPFTPDTTMWIASLTKLMTAVSVMQCVEKGLLNLDDDISTVLPEFKDPEIILGFEEATGKPNLERTKAQITVRMLLTHQSGMGYAFMQPKLEHFAKYKKIGGGLGSNLVREMYLLPVLFEPGTSWVYGTGLDWAGQIVERVTNQTLNSYMTENIWKPLGMDSTTFHPGERPDIKSRRADMSLRAANGAVGPSPTRLFSDDAPDAHGGGGAFSCAGDYIKILISLLKNDGTLLKPSATDVLFSPCLPPGPTEAFRENRTAAYKAYRATKIGSEKELVVHPVEMNHAVGGQVSEKDAIGGRKAGSLSWSGLPNLLWFIDRESGVTLLFCSQLLPPGDDASRAMFERFESAVYRGEFGDIVGTKAWES